MSPYGARNTVGEKKGSTHVVDGLHPVVLIRGHVQLNKNVGWLSDGEHLDRGSIVDIDLESRPKGGKCQLEPSVYETGVARAQVSAACS